MYKEILNKNPASHINYIYIYHWQYQLHIICWRDVCHVSRENTEIKKLQIQNPDISKAQWHAVNLELQHRELHWNWDPVSPVGLLLTCHVVI